MTACVICQEVEAEPGSRACPRDAGRLAGALRQIPKLVDELRVELVPDDDARDPVAVLLPAGPQKGSWRESRIRSTRPERLPIAVDPTDLLMPPRNGSLAVAARSPWPDDQTGHLSVATVLDFWVRDWADLRGEGLPSLRVRCGCDPATGAECRWHMTMITDGSRRDPAGERSPAGLLARWLSDRLDWALREHPALDEFAKDVSEIFGALFGLARGGRVVPKAMEAACPRCGWLALTQETPEDDIVCQNPDCRRVLSQGEYAEHVRSLIDAG